MNGGPGAAMPNGYILLHRKLIDASFYRRPLVVRLFTHILMAANHHPGTVLIRNQPFKLQPGQAVVSIRGLAEDTGISMQSARTALALLIRCGTLKSTHPATRGPTIITVCNWAAYQFVPSNGDTPTNTPPTHRQHTANTIRKEREGDKEEKEDSCAEPDEPATAPVVSVMTFPVKATADKPKEWPLTQAKLDEYAETFVGMDVLGQCRKARLWCVENPAKRKTARGMGKFLFGWIERSNNRGQAGRIPEEKGTRL